MERVSWIAAYAVGAAFRHIDEREVVATLVEAGLNPSLLPTLEMPSPRSRRSTGASGTRRRTV